MSGIQLRKVAKRFGNITILDDINLTIEPGEFVVFIGPSGCGKSTLLRLIAGLEDTTEGDIEIDGKIVNDLPPANRNVAMVFQSYALYPHMTVYENMAFGLRQQKMPEAEIKARVAEASRILQMQKTRDLLPCKPRDLSGGQRQRVAIGRAIVRKPKVFLFDEPLSNLDASLRVETRVEIAKLHRKIGTASMIYVTHDQVEAMTLADKIVLLQPKDPKKPELPSIAQVGHPLELYHRPANQFVASFIGSPSMNFLPSVVQQADQQMLKATAGTATLQACVEGKGIRIQEPVTLGIRPEHVRIGQGGACRGRATHVEHLGEHSYVYLDPEHGEQQIIAKFQQERINIGDNVPFDLPAEAVHVFKKDGTSLPRVLV
jgi:multiple sugar transport system ATP-binding protein